MSVPSRVQAAAIVSRLAPSERLLRHSTAVAEIAAFLCSAMARRGLTIDSTMIETAAFLHDVDKMLPKEDPLRKLGHGAAGAEWVRQQGHAELADAIALHPVMALAGAPSYDDWADRAGFEGRVVAYSDKRARQELISLDERFSEWHARYPESEPLRVAHDRARRLEKVICALAGLRPADVGREPWVAEAMRATA